MTQFEIFLHVQPKIPALQAPADSLDPLALDRKPFGYWLSGMTDGDGSFHYYREKTGQPHIRFRIGLRADDLPVLEAIREYWGHIGGIYKQPARDRGTHITAASCSFEVYCSQTHKEALVVVKHFEQFPLFSKKAAAFELWKQMVDVYYDKGPCAAELDALGKQLSSIQGCRKQESAAQIS